MKLNDSKDVTNLQWMQGDGVGFKRRKEISHAHDFDVLLVSAATIEEIKVRLKEAGVESEFYDPEGDGTVILPGIALVRRDESDK